VAGTDTVETISFTLANETKQVFTLNPHAWVLFRHDGVDWTHVAAADHEASLQTVSRRETYERVLSGEPHPTPGGDRRLYPTVDVGAGEYALAVDGRLGDADAPGAERTTDELIARFEDRPAETTGTNSV
jgi:hypothetical protein